MCHGDMPVLAWGGGVSVSALAVVCKAILTQELWVRINKVIGSPINSILSLARADNS